MVLARPNASRPTKRWRLQLPDEAGVLTEYAGHTTAVEFPNASAPSVKYGDGGSRTFEADATCVVTLDQDVTPGSLYRLLLDNAGKSADLTVWPHEDVAFGLSSTVSLVRPPFKADRGGLPASHAVTMPATTPTVITELPPTIEPETETEPEA